MQYLKIKRRKDRPSEAYFVTSRGKYDKNRSELYIQKKRCYLITGDADSGKTRLLRRLHKEHNSIYKTKSFYFSAIDPIAVWLNQAKEGDNQHEKLDSLVKEIEESKVTIYFDDLHKLTGRKMQIAKLILNSTNHYMISALGLQRIPPTMRRLADDSKVKLIELDSDVAFDGTIGIVMLFIIGGALAGFPEIAIVAGIGGLLANGRLGSNNNT